MKAVIPTNTPVYSWLVVIFVGAIWIVAVFAQPSNSIELNENAFTFATQLIKQGQFVADGKGAWANHRPSAAEENDFIRLYGFAQYAKWHLGIDRRFPENSKRRYKFPYGDFKSVHRCGLLAVKARARQYGYAQIEKAAAELDRAIKKKNPPKELNSTTLNM